ncbi:MAG: hypothetical protein GC151_18605 [Betaproteobacteria bacterium]|nr:hypothetical protein [Betaproteobacteria bacterium]
MARVSLARNLPNPRRTNTFVDTCAFDPKVAPEHSAAQRIREIRNAGNISILLAHSNQKEIEHPNTPADVKAEARDMTYTIAAPLTPAEIEQRALVRQVMTGEGNPDQYEADADHIFEAGKYGGGYFVTTDPRILGRKAELDALSGAIIVKPTEWLAIYEAAN